MKRPTMHTDPSGTIGLVATFVGAVLGLLVAFGVELTDTQVDAILLVVSTGGPLVVAVLIRRRAYAPVSVDEARAEAWRDGYRLAEHETRAGLEGRPADAGAPPDRTET